MRFAIISDIHGNFPALTAVLEDAERNGLPEPGRPLRFAEKYAEETGDNERPFSISTWEGAYKAWENRIHSL